MILGNTFLVEHYTVIDIDKDMIGLGQFAKALPSDYPEVVPLDSVSDSQQTNNDANNESKYQILGIVIVIISVLIFACCVVKYSFKRKESLLFEEPSRDQQADEQRRARLRQVSSSIGSQGAAAAELMI